MAKSAGMGGNGVSLELDSLSKIPEYLFAKLLQRKTIRREELSHTQRLKVVEEEKEKKGRRIGEIFAEADEKNRAAKTNSASAPAATRQLKPSNVDSRIMTWARKIAFNQAGKKKSETTEEEKQRKLREMSHGGAVVHGNSLLSEICRQFNNAPNLRDRILEDPGIAHIVYLEEESEARNGMDLGRPGVDREISPDKYKQLCKFVLREVVGENEQFDRAYLQYCAKEIQNKMIKTMTKFEKEDERRASILNSIAVASMEKQEELHTNREILLDVMKGNGMDVQNLLGIRSRLQQITQNAGEPDDIQPVTEAQNDTEGGDFLLTQVKLALEPSKESEAPQSTEVFLTQMESKAQNRGLEILESLKKDSRRARDDMDWSSSRGRMTLRKGARTVREHEEARRRFFKARLVTDHTKLYEKTGNEVRIPAVKSLKTSTSGRKMQSTELAVHAERLKQLEERQKQLVEDVIKRSRALVRMKTTIDPMPETTILRPSTPMALSRKGKRLLPKSKTMILLHEDRDTVDTRRHQMMKTSSQKHIQSKNDAVQVAERLSEREDAPSPLFKLSMPAKRIFSKSTAAEMTKSMGRLIVSPAIKSELKAERKNQMSLSVGKLAQTGRGSATTGTIKGKHFFGRWKSQTSYSATGRREHINTEVDDSDAKRVTRQNRAYFGELFKDVKQGIGSYFEPPVQPEDEYEEEGQNGWLSSERLKEEITKTQRVLHSELQQRANDLEFAGERYANSDFDKYLKQRWFKDQIVQQLMAKTSMEQHHKYIATYNDILQRSQRNYDKRQQKKIRLHQI